MENKKNLLLTILLILTIAGAAAWYFMTHSSNSSTSVISDQGKTQATSGLARLISESTQKDTFQDSKDWYDVTIEYPKNNELVKKEILDTYNSWAKDTGILGYNDSKSAREGLGLFAPEQKYSYSASYAVASSSNSLTYLYTIYSYTGGAHGSTTYLPITLDSNGQKIDIATILSDANLQTVSAFAEKDIARQVLERAGKAEDAESAKFQSDWIKDGTSPKRENYSTVWYDGEDVVVSFGQYQVAAYVFGSFEVRIPKSMLK